jgi:hypothetical protein
MAYNWHQSGPFSVHLVKEHHCCPNFLGQPIRREEKFGPTSKLAIYEHKCKHNKRTNRQISLALYCAKIVSLYAAVYRVSNKSYYTYNTCRISAICCQVGTIHSTVRRFIRGCMTKSHSEIIFWTSGPPKKKFQILLHPIFGLQFQLKIPMNNNHGQMSPGPAYTKTCQGQAQETLKLHSIKIKVLKN